MDAGYDAAPKTGCSASGRSSASVRGAERAHGSHLRSIRDPESTLRQQHPASLRPFVSQRVGQGSVSRATDLLLPERPLTKETAVSTPLNHLSPLSVRERSTCMCRHGFACSSFEAGHALHLIQARIASATPSEWADAIVEHADATTGELLVRTLDDLSLIHI